MDSNNHLFCLFSDYCVLKYIPKEDISKKYISEKDYDNFSIFLRENDLNEIGDNIVIHTKSHEYTINAANSFIKRKSGTNSFIAATSHKEIISYMKEPIPIERALEFLEFLKTIDDRFLPRGRDHIFQRFKQEIVDKFNVRMSLDGLSKTAVYYILMHEVIPEFRIQFQDSREMPYTQNGIHHSYKLAKLLASLWIAIVIPDDEISEIIFHHFNDVYTNQWVLDGMPSMIMALIAFGKNEESIAEFEKSQRASRERREERKEESGSGEDGRGGKQPEEDSKKTSKQKRQEANKLKKKTGRHIMTL